ncbi:MAG TPA: DEAD/DEAH box helicase [Actinomycetota bacterium]|nr:DEAD/DEAH box helicase [Actinomycetota bacterium]
MTNSFLDLGVSEVTERALTARGIAAPFEVQTRVIPDAIAGKDVLVRSRTGSGKTLAFAIPMIERMDPKGIRPSALILTPTRELASQVAGEFAAIASPKNLRVATIYGGTSIRTQQRAASKAHILVATPGRLEDVVSRGLISLEHVTILVLDEADHMLDMGFAPQVEKLVARISKNRQTMLFSATLDGEVGRIAQRYTRSPVSHRLEAEPTIKDVEHKFVAVGTEHKVDRLAEMLQDQPGSTLVFVRTKHGADRLAMRLSASGIAATAMHGNKNQSQRERALAAFASGRVTALVATDVAARGIDVRNVARVVNFDPPTEDNSFVHRVGRTGRAGKKGISITFVAPHERSDVGRMAQRLSLEKEFAIEHGALRAPSRDRQRQPARGERPGSFRGRPSRGGPQQRSNNRRAR